MQSYYSVQKLLIPHLLSNTLKIRVFKTIFLSFLTDVKHSLLIWRKNVNHKSENKVLTKKFGPETEEVKWAILNITGHLELLGQ